MRVEAVRVGLVLRGQGEPEKVEVRHDSDDFQKVHAIVIDNLMDRRFSHGI